MSLGALPPADVVVPAAVRRLAAGRETIGIWRNVLGGLTFRLGAGGPYVKWAPPGSVLPLAAERDRLAWAAGRGVAVPRVREFGEDGEGTWLLTDPLPGENAVSARWAAAPARAAAGIGRGLRRLHDTLDPDACPFREAWHTRPLGAGRPAVQEPVVVHGDACAPNTLLDDTGEPTGHVDLGALAVGDRWADLAIATWSLEWNFGPGFDAALLDAYGIAADPARIEYYRRAWEESDPLS